ncbi:SET domain-containing protein [Fusarium pseudocircinatum]|uniref:SET domain-containing protein n=1 Tax=Fusarium pseudocircinatum TaxID=56676 RepID=A0A8H5P8M3_9HYPO|nr:SET domain-containing protein [Fusarium pseudocircinatum]
MGWGTSGFDMVPRLSSGAQDQLRWDEFIERVMDVYGGDIDVEFKDNYIKFEAGEQLLLPLEGHKFLRFSSTLNDHWLTAETCIDVLRVIAREFFDFRIRGWREQENEFGYYTENEVKDSLRLYEQPDPPISIVEPLFEVRDIRGRGRGLIAKVDIPAGTRILCEKPLLLASTTIPGDLEATAAPRLEDLLKSQQREFLSLHNNFPGKDPFSGIIRTNALPCGPGSIVGGVYPTICLINHSCLPNSHQNWNSEAGHETIHAIRQIKAGEEITISYYEGGPSMQRRPMLKRSFGFDCACSLCSLPPSQLRASDVRRVRIQQLGVDIKNLFTMKHNPEANLKACLTLLHTLQEEYGVCVAPHSARLYDEAFRICIAHGAVGRPTTFAEKSYQARVICEGEDSPETLRMKELIMEPETHDRFGALSLRWKSKDDSAFSYGHYGTVEAEKRLFRQE